MGSGRWPPRAEVVGSLLRPPRLRAAVEAFYAPGHVATLDSERAKDRAALRAAEDAAIDAAVRRQIDLGLDVVTDGEFRRWMFLNSFYDAVEGVRTDNVVVFRNDRGEEVPLAVHEVVGRLRPVDSPAARESAYLARVAAPHPFKVSFPAASIFAHPFSFKVGITDGAYASLDELVADAVRIEQQLVADAVAAGARYVQFDFPLYPYLVDPVWVARFEQAGHRRDSLLARALAADAAVLDAVPEGVRTALHICRGNHRSSWMCAGSLEPVAEQVLGGLGFDSFLVEWDDLGRDGGYGPARQLRPGAILVMGVISTKTPELETREELLGRMEQAASAAGGMDRLGISPQCGFASTLPGNEIDEETQWRKLELVSTVADRLWPS